MRAGRSDRRQVLGALRSAPRCSSRRRTRATAASNVLAALRMLVEPCASHPALAGQRKRLDQHRQSEPIWLSVVRPSRLLLGEPASYDRPALPAPKAPLLRPYLAGNPPRFRLDRRQACCCGVGASGRQPGARPPSLATRISCTRGIITRHPSRGSCPSRSAVFVLCLAAPRGAEGCTSCPHARTCGARSGFAAAASTARCSTAAAARRRLAPRPRCGFGPPGAASTRWATGGPSRPRPRCWRASCCPTSTSIASWCRSIYMCAAAHPLVVAWPRPGASPTPTSPSSLLVW